MDLTYNDTSETQDYIDFTQSSDKRWNITEENIKKVKALMDTNKSLEKQSARDKERIAYLVSEVNKLDKEANFWWRQTEIGNL